MMLRCRATLAFSLLCALFASAQQPLSVAELAAEIPACARPRLDEASVAAGCAVTDYACQCGPKKQEITIAASPKVIEACGTEARQVLEATNALCEAATIEETPQTLVVESTVISILGFSRTTSETAPARAGTTRTTSEVAPLRAETSQTLIVESTLESATIETTQTLVVESTLSPETYQSTPAASRSSSTTFRAVTTTTGRSSVPTSPAANSGPNRSYSANGGLSTGAKAGIAVGAGAGALFLDAVIFLLCRRRRRKFAPLRVLGSTENASSDQAEKAELAGTDPKGWSRFKLAPKPELSADQKSKDSKHAIAVAELEHREQRDLVPELDDHKDHRHEASGTRSQYSTTYSPAGHQDLLPMGGDHTTFQQPTMSSQEFSQNEPASTAGPLPTASDLYPIPQTTSAAVAEETDFEYQVRRLQERRAMIAERKRLAGEEEQIAMEEEALRRKKAIKGGRA